MTLHREPTHKSETMEDQNGLDQAFIGWDHHSPTEYHTHSSMERCLIISLTVISSCVLPILPHARNAGLIERSFLPVGAL